MNKPYVNEPNGAAISANVPEFRIAECLHLTAAPTFALTALLTGGVFGEQPWLVNEIGHRVALGILSQAPIHVGKLSQFDSCFRSDRLFCFGVKLGGSAPVFLCPAH